MKLVSAAPLVVVPRIASLLGCDFRTACKLFNLAAKRLEVIPSPRLATRQSPRSLQLRRIETYDWKLQAVNENQRHELHRLIDSHFVVPWISE
jgi:hypothetical protein